MSCASRRNPGAWSTRAERGPAMLDKPLAHADLWIDHRTAAQRLGVHRDELAEIARKMKMRVNVHGGVRSPFYFHEDIAKAEKLGPRKLAEMLMQQAK